MLRTRRTENGRVLFILSGRVETTEDIELLQQLLAVETCKRQLVLDLKDVTLVNQDAIEFLRLCEAGGITLENHYSAQDLRRISQQICGSDQHAPGR